VVAIFQSNNTTEQSNLTVSMVVTDPAAFQFVFFQFCQLSSSVCYTPAIVMTLHGADTFVGTTKRMSAYAGMLDGVKAGYNITIEYTNGTNASEPALPNTFPGLTVVTTVANYYDFEMVVVPQTFGLSGVVSNAATHTAIAGASVSLSPGNFSTAHTDSSGAYTFAAVANGSYSLTVSDPGYPDTVTTVKINGQNDVQNVAVSNTTGANTGPPPEKGAGNFFTSPSGLAVIGGAAVAVVVVALAAVLLFRRRKTARDPVDPARADASPPGPKGPN
jgi:hypothetical protein